ncbi:MAG: ATP-binding protein [Calditrichia bacterium]|nr:ATP-binding protein [Calditrichia bacterium]
MKSLFQAGRPVLGTKLIGREEILKKIISYLISGQSIVLLAPRRFGKTSIVIEVLNRFKSKGSFTAYVDIFATPGKRILSEQITESVLLNKKLHKAFSNFRKNFSSMMQQVEFKQTIEDFEFILNFADKNQDELTLLTNSLDFIENFAIKYNKQIICGFDEFGDIEKINGKEIVKLFRSKIQLQKNSSYIFSGSQESVMEKIFITSKSPFYRFAKIIQINEIQPEIFVNYIRKEFSKISINVNDEALNILMEFTNGHPYYTQLICQHLEYLLIGTKKNNIDRNDMLEAIDDAFWSEINYIEKLWDELSSGREQAQVLINIAESTQSLYSSLDLNKLNVSRALRKLKSKGIIRKENQYNVLVDPMLKYFIRKDILKWDINQCMK